MRALRWSIGRDGGAGSILALAILGAAAMAVVAALAMGSALVVRQRVIGAADNAAVAAADVVSGAAPGVPCEAAARVVAANGATLNECIRHGFRVTVTASARVGLLSVAARSIAGPPR